MKKVCIIGSGRQGTAAAYDLISYVDDIELTFLDIDLKQAEKASQRIFFILGYKAKTKSEQN